MESEYWQSHTVLTNEVEDTIASYYTEKEIDNYARESKANFNRINADASFWFVTTRALQTTFMITLGRIFDHDKGSHSIRKLLNETVTHPEYFSKDRLARRKYAGAGPEPVWLNEYIKTLGSRTWLVLRSCVMPLRPVRRNMMRHSSRYATSYMRIKTLWTGLVSRPLSERVSSRISKKYFTICMTCYRAYGNSHTMETNQSRA